ncbi:hypothetical protein D6825_01270 [Candidatus Woesearchaeota archaeon]|nr:MAG: hypothetical protein D6825_01270 [Candidatus Woesearchaeota archaeon]
MDIEIGDENRRLEKVVNADGLESLCTVSGSDLMHCLYIAFRYNKSFLEEVGYYRICKEEESLDKRCPLTVEFYKRNVE